MFSGRLTVRPSVVRPLTAISPDVIFLLSGGILMKLGTSIVNGHCGKEFQGHGVKVQGQLATAI